MTNPTPIEDVIPDEILKAMKKIPIGDPVLVLVWNDARLDQARAANARHTKQSVINRLLNNGATDEKNSGTIFHFPMTNHIQTAREDFLARAIWTMGTTAQMRANLGVPAIEPIAETFIIQRLTRNELDYADAQFFYY